MPTTLSKVLVIAVAGYANAMPTASLAGPKTVEIVNDASDAYLHVFLQLHDESQRWNKADGNGKIYDPIHWGVPGQADAWDPLGAKVASEAIIPKGGSIVLDVPNLSPPQFVMMAVKMTDPENANPVPATPASKFCSGVPCEVMPGQHANLIEAGISVVSDSSAVDGFNYRVKYQLTSDGGVKSTDIITNPCAGLGPKYQDKAGGCQNPAKVDCSGKPTCDCKSDQNCKFNSCTKLLFDVPADLEKYFDMYDGGNPNGAPVKTFINNANNLKDGSPLKSFCKAAHGVGDFSTYCYDYNDPGASPWLRDPFEISVTYSDLA